MLWALNAHLLALKMDYEYIRSARISRIERRNNEEVRTRMKAEETVVDKIEKRSLKWFGHLLRMPEEREPKRIFHWRSLERRKQGRPRERGIRTSEEQT